MRKRSLRLVHHRAACFSGAALLTLVWLPAASAQTPPAPLSDVERAVHLLNRTTYGVRAEDVAEVLQMGASSWLDRQLGPESISMPPLAGAPSDALRPNDPADPSATAPTAARGMEPTPLLDPLIHQHTASLERLRALVFRVSPVAVPEVTAKLERAIASPKQLEEVMTDFWFNHFSVSHSKGDVGSALVDYEDTAIRPFVFRRFEDLLIETARHPAMLMYLDTYLSRAPGSAGGPGQGSGGINENYARELLELHTLGVDGGYTQQDVIAVARAFTGWTVPMRPLRPDGPFEVVIGGRIPFEFRLSWHDQEEKVVLGQTLPAGRGMGDGLDVLRLLARHPSTARHIATKLVRHFVADDPPQEMVDELEQVFLATGGDLREVTRTLFTSERFYRPEHFRAKVKRPFEFVASALRVSGGGLEIRDRNLREQRVGILSQLQVLEHVPYNALAPTGYPVTSEEWVGAGSMLIRMNLAVDIAHGRMPGVALDPLGTLGDLTVQPGADATPTSIAEAVTHRLLFGRPADGVRAAISGDLQRMTSADTYALAARAVGLALGSPEFQRY